MDTDREHLLVRIGRLTPPAEKIALAGLTIGLLMQYANLNGLPVVQYSLVALAIIFFLGAYVPIELPEQNEPGDFSHLLVLTIMPKIVMITAAVSTFGIFLFLLNTGNKGYLQLLLIGSSTSFIAFVIYLYGVLKSMEGVTLLLPLFYRAMPFAIAAAYIFIQNRV